ncbi:hypothetical protein WJX72_004954 [[Myrmecia] bisecta]|uniref:Fungal lipase-type domain-containing protein n=1 Tax=[Myrmecia] bisecta TaxID=41462 RepID=A0AAW1Q132_9CHLO
MEAKPWQSSTGGYPMPHEADEELGSIDGHARSSAADNGDQCMDVVLQMECIAPFNAKALIVFVYAAVMVGLAALLVQFSKIMTLDPHRGPFQDLTSPIINTTVAGVCLVLLSTSMGTYVERVVRGKRLGKSWSRRRGRFASLLFVELAVQWVNVACWLIPNAWLLVHRCGYFATVLIPWAAFVRWTCWNTVLFLFLVHAHNMNPWKAARSLRRTSSGALDSIILDAPWCHHWPKLLLWGIMEGAIAVCCFMYAYGPDALRPYRISKPAGQEGNCQAWTFDCGYVPRQRALVIVMVAFAFIYFGLYLLVIRAAKLSLREKPYAEFKMDHVIVHLQMRMRATVFTFFILSITLLWLVRPACCAAFAFTWLGLLPMQVVMTAAVLAWSCLTMPQDPDATAPLVQARLSDFAWTEGEHAAKTARCPAGVQQEPMFCMARALKAHYWSGLVYHYDQAHADKGGWSIEKGLALWDLQSHELFWEMALDTKCLMGWSSHTCVMAFKGTSSITNALADLQAWRTVHPPQRGHYWLGTQPMVHAGFLKSFHVGGLNQKVVGRVVDVLRGAGADDGRLVNVFVTGHSLGGALATLAAYDIATALKAAGIRFRIACYTYGAPRTGNHAFARDYERVVPDTWSVINDQDAVAHGAKMLMLYKRAGQRVILNGVGDMLVRPTFFQASMHRVPGGSSVAHHLLTNYQKSLLAILLAQFTSKRLPGGAEGVLALAKASWTVQDMLLQRAGLLVEELEGLCRLGKFLDIKTIARLGSRPAKDTSQHGSRRSWSLSHGSGRSWSLSTSSAASDALGDAEELNIFLLSAAFRRTVVSLPHNVPCFSARPTPPKSDQGIKRIQG